MITVSRIVKILRYFEEQPDADRCSVHINYRPRNPGESVEHVEIILWRSSARRLRSNRLIPVLYKSKPEYQYGEMLHMLSVVGLELLPMFSGTGYECNKKLLINNLPKKPKTT